MKIVVVPSGQGDYSWLHAKLWHVRNQIARIEVVDGWPQRTVPFVEACGFPASYADVTYAQILQAGTMYDFSTWEKIAAAGTDRILLQANTHLEAGKPLADWLPDLPTNYHYPLQISDDDRLRAGHLLATACPTAGPVVGISAASYRGSEAWNTWNRREWTTVLRAMLRQGWTPVLLGGFWDDLTAALSETLAIPNLVGKTSVGEMIAIQDLFDAYVGFSSGLGVIRTVLNKPCLMLWPAHQELLSTAWAPPHMLDSQRYVACQWDDPDAPLTIAKFLNRCELQIMRPVVQQPHTKDNHGPLSAIS